jgi:hypothetical protein
VRSISRQKKCGLEDISDAAFAYKLCSAATHFQTRSSAARIFSPQRSICHEKTLGCEFRFA